MRASRVVLTDAEIEAAIRLEHKGKPSAWIEEEVQAAAAPRIKAQADYDKAVGKGV